MKIKFNLHDELPLSKAIEIPGTIIAFRAIFYEYNDYCPQDDYLYKL